MCSGFSLNPAFLPLILEIIKKFNPGITEYYINTQVCRFNKVDILEW
jgi:hypothetical protein